VSSPAVHLDTSFLILIGLSQRLEATSVRRWISLADCMIAATAINAGASLATADVADFDRFVPFDLVLEPL
jgi:predicted nucleic acid-binding protein